MANDSPPDQLTKLVNSVKLVLHFVTSTTVIAFSVITLLNLKLIKSMVTADVVMGKDH